MVKKWLVIRRFQYVVMSLCFACVTLGTLFAFLKDKLTQYVHVEFNRLRMRE